MLSASDSSELLAGSGGVGERLAMVKACHATRYATKFNVNEGIVNVSILPHSAPIKYIAVIDKIVIALYNECVLYVFIPLHLSC